MCAQILTQALLFLGTLCKSSVGSTLGHNFTSLLFMLILMSLNYCRLQNFKIEKFRIFFFFSKREILESCQSLTTSLGLNRWVFDTSGLIFNANMSIYALAQVLLSLNLWGGRDRRFFKFRVSKFSCSYISNNADRDLITETAI